MAGTRTLTNNPTREASPTTQSLRALAQSHLDTIKSEIEAEAAQQATTERDLARYAKVKRKDRPRSKATPSPPPETKGTKLRSAQDVLDRLRHDQTLRDATYYIGYLERFEGIKEMPARGWITESTDEEWIPQHRIRYVRRVDAQGNIEIVWDRDRRIDKVFGSGGVAEDDEIQSEAGGVAL